MFVFLKLITSRLTCLMLNFLFHQFLKIAFVTVCYTFTVKERHKKVQASWENQPNLKSFCSNSEKFTLPNRDLKK